MNVCELLNNIKKLDQLIECKTAERKRLIDIATDISPGVLDGMPRSNTGTVSQKLQNAVVDLVILESELKKLIADYIDQKQKIVAIIEKLPENEYGVIHRYYIRNMTLEAIADDMGYCVRQIKRIKKRALITLEDVLLSHHATGV